MLVALWLIDHPLVNLSDSLSLVSSLKSIRDDVRSTESGIDDVVQFLEHFSPAAWDGTPENSTPEWLGRCLKLQLFTVSMLLSLHFWIIVA